MDMTDKKWFWLLVGVVVARAWEGHAARACLGEAWPQKVFSPSNLTGSVFGLSGAGCGGCPPAAPCNCGPEKKCEPTKVGCGCGPGTRERAGSGVVYVVR